MKLNYDTPGDGTHCLRITDDKSRWELLMEYDQQLEHYSLAMRNENEVEPLDSIKRRPGEDNEIYFDRASALATRIYLNKLCEEIEVQSRYQRMQPLIEALRNKLYHMIGVLDHWDNLEPTEEELDQLQQLIFSVTNNDETLTTLS